MARMPACCPSGQYLRKRFVDLRVTLVCPHSPT